MILSLYLILLVCVVFTDSFHIHSTRALQTPSVINGRHELNMISHGMGFNRLSRPADQRKALLRALTTEIIRHGRIRTTVVKAKAMRKEVDHMITLAKRGTLHARRQALAYIYDKSLVASLFDSVMERYGDRHGGYCRVIKEKIPRRGDNANMAIIELV